MDDMTEEEQKIVEELKRRTMEDVTPKMLEDVSLFYRFAKARDFNLAEAEAMLRKHISWRKEMQIDTILTEYEPPEVLVKYAPTTFICFDKMGSIVRVNDCGRTDLKGLWSSVKKAELGKYFCYHMEKDKEMMIKSGRNLGKPMYAVIYDFENLTYGNAVNIKTLQFATYILKTFVDNYPETIRKVSAINVPFYFTWIYSAIKAAIPETVCQKIGVYGTEGWKETLLEENDPNDLPAYLGGNRTDPDGNPLCETFMMRGKPIPKSYFMNKRSKRLSLAHDAEKLIVRPFSKEEVTFEVKEENSYLEWEIEIESGDINFSLIFRKEPSEDFAPVEILPKQRIDSSDDLEKGCNQCEEIGMYSLVFDNSYSWFHSKEVYYKARIKGQTNTD